MRKRSIWIGFDDREAMAFSVARESLTRCAPYMTSVNSIILEELRTQGIYTRETREVNGRLHDVVSNAPMSTQFAISRFFVPWLVKSRFVAGPFGWALFTDCDVLCRQDLTPLFELAEANPHKALFCVHHNHKVVEGAYKMEGAYEADAQVQVNYARKNWSSVMMFNCDHPSNDAVTLRLLNDLPGRDLHRFCWLDDNLLGEMDAKWNWLVNVSPDLPVEPAIVHFTEGGPWLSAYRDVPYSREWREAFRRWAAPTYGGLRPNGPAIATTDRGDALLRTDPVAIGIGYPSWHPTV